MKKILTLLGATGLVTSTATAVVACSPDTTGDNSSLAVSLSATSVSVGIIKESTIKILNATSLTEIAIAKNNSNAAATINSDTITITGLKVGTTIVTVSASNATSATITVTITATPDITINQEDQNLEKGKTLVVSILTGQDLEGLAVKSEIESIATVSPITDDKFIVEGIKIGRTNIAISAKDKNTVYLVITVTEDFSIEVSGEGTAIGDVLSISGAKTLDAYLKHETITVVPSEITIKNESDEIAIVKYEKVLQKFTIQSISNGDTKVTINVKYATKPISFTISVTDI